MPMSSDFKQRLLPHLADIAAHFGTPFHLYDEAGIRATGTTLLGAFAAFPGFQEFYAVKALPNPRILAILHKLGFGFDCSSVPELVLARQVGARPDEIMFTSNNTSPAEFDAALADGGCILNLDDAAMLERLPALPYVLSFRYNPGAERTGNAIIGNPVEAKFGMREDQLLDGYQHGRDLGIRRFGLHSMLVSNERDYRYMVETTRMLLELAAKIEQATGIVIEFINIGGGLGIPYRPGDAALDIDALGREAVVLFAAFQQAHGRVPRLTMESGRYVTGPHGVLVTRVLNRKETYRTYIGVDANMSALMRPGMYGAYHHIDIPGAADDAPLETVDVVGALCENNDKFGIQRPLPRADVGDLVLIHDTGAHGLAMGFQYNGRLRPQELLLRADGSVERIRRAETLDDYFATLRFQPQVWLAQ